MLEASEALSRQLQRCGQTVAVRVRQMQRLDLENKAQTHFTVSLPFSVGKSAVCSEKLQVSIVQPSSFYVVLGPAV